MNGMKTVRGMMLVLVMTVLGASNAFASASISILQFSNQPNYSAAGGSAGGLGR